MAISRNKLSLAIQVALFSSLPVLPSHAFDIDLTDGFNMTFSNATLNDMNVSTEGSGAFTLNNSQVTDFSLYSAGNGTETRYQANFLDSTLNNSRIFVYDVSGDRSVSFSNVTVNGGARNSAGNGGDLEINIFQDDYKGGEVLYTPLELNVINSNFTNFTMSVGAYSNISLEDSVFIYDEDVVAPLLVFHSNYRPGNFTASNLTFISNDGWLRIESYDALITNNSYIVGNVDAGFADLTINGNSYLEGVISSDTANITLDNATLSSPVVSNYTTSLTISDASGRINNSYISSAGNLFSIGHGNLEITDSWLVSQDNGLEKQGSYIANGKLNITNSTLIANNQKLFSLDDATANVVNSDLTGAIISVFPGMSNNSSLTLNNSTWAMTPWSETDASANTSSTGYLALSNNSIVILNYGNIGDTLIVGNDLTGSGTFVMDTLLNEGASQRQSDLIDVQGNVDGNFKLNINSQGAGALTTNEGILLVHVGGTNKGNFSLSHRVIGGIYEYFLTKAESNGQYGEAGSVYLTSHRLGTAAVAPASLMMASASAALAPDTLSADKSAAVTEIASSPAATQGSAPVNDVSAATISAVETADAATVTARVTSLGVAIPTIAPSSDFFINPETGSFVNNVAVANNLFNHRMRDRVGQQYNTGSSMWLRNIGSRTEARSAGNQLKSTTNAYIVQLGGDVAGGSFGEHDSWRLGVMGGYASASSKTHSLVSASRAEGSVNGYSVGFYGSWLQNGVAAPGWYVDSWVQYGWFNNKVAGVDNGAKGEFYDSDGFSASLETGYSAQLWQGERASLFVEPQGQVTWNNIKADDVKNSFSTGTQVSQKDDNFIQTRLGVRLYANTHATQDDNTARRFQPFIEANWLHNDSSYAVAFNGETISQKGQRNIGELKVGLEGKLANNLNVWGNVAGQRGDNAYSHLQGTLGVRYSF